MSNPHEEQATQTNLLRQDFEAHEDDTALHSGGGGGGGGDLDDLDDVTVPAPDDGDVLTYDNATGEWINSPASGGVSDHGGLTGLGDDDHPQYTTTAEATTVADASVATHAGLGDPHTGYRLESADHTHASAGAQAGTVDHGVLTGLADDDHPQYATNAEFDDHSARHEDGGADEISLTGLSGTPADLTTHAGAADPHTGYLKESDLAGQHSHNANTAAGGGASISVGTVFELAAEGDDTQVGTQATWAITNLSSKSIFQWKGASALVARGISNQAGGRLIVLHNEGSDTITLNHEDPSATQTFHRFDLPGDTNYVLAVDDSCILEYNNDTSRWKIIGHSHIPATAGAPTNADYLVGTANASLSNEIAVGASPGGELGGTWASPTVDATHSGSAHHDRLHSITDTNDHTFPGGATYLQANGTFSAPSAGALADFAPAVLTPADIAADQNNYAPAGIADVTVLRLRTNDTTTRIITGINATQAAGQTLFIHNVGTTGVNGTITLSHGNASSTAGNRFDIYLAADQNIAVGSNCMLVYDGVTSRWLVHHNTPLSNDGAGGSTVTVDAAGAHGSLTLAAGDSHGHRLNTSSATPAANTSGGTAGTATTAPSRGDHAHPGPTLVSSGAAPAAGAANGAAAPSQTYLLNTADNAVTTVETVMSLTGVAAGTYLYEYYIVWRSGTVTVGCSFNVDFTGTVTRMRNVRYGQTTLATAADGIADGTTASLTGGVVQNWANVADNAALGPNTGVGSTTEDQYEYIRGTMVVSTSGTLNLTMTGEGNAAVTFMADSAMELTRLA